MSKREPERKPDRYRGRNDFPLNIVSREALDSLIPLARQYDVGLAVMKPVSVGTIPAEIALPWLIHHDVWYNHFQAESYY